MPPFPSRCAPKTATFNTHTHTEAPEPMAGAVVARYDACPQRAGEPMKRRSKAGGKSAKAQPRELLKLKRHTAPKVAAGRNPAMRQTADWLGTARSPAIRAGLCRKRHQLFGPPDLTDQDLKEIGVSLGHRRRTSNSPTGRKMLRRAPSRLHRPPRHKTPPSAGKSQCCSRTSPVLRATSWRPSR